MKTKINDNTLIPNSGENNFNSNTAKDIAQNILDGGTYVWKVTTESLIDVTKAGAFAILFLPCTFIGTGAAIIAKSFNRTIK